MSKRWKIAWLCFDLCIVLGMVLIVVALYHNTWFDKLAYCSRPVCLTDKHEFTSNKCSECKKKFKTNAVFVKKYIEDYDNALDDEQYTYINASKYYKNYNAYLKDYSRGMIYCMALLSVFVTFVIFNIILAVQNHRGNKAKKKEKKVKLKK
jgi:Sec7-like guanine-nucleotide exchange factor